MEYTRDLRAIAKEKSDKLKKIKVLLCDVDGILTTGHVYWGGQIGFNRFFHVLDGYGLKFLRQHGVKVGVISGGDSEGLNKRAEYLHLDYVFVGNEDKREAFKSVLKDGFTPEEICYMGDELFDIPILKKAGFAATVPNCSHEVKECVDYITEREGGRGAVREVIDLIRYAQNMPLDIPDFDL